MYVMNVGSRAISLYLAIYLVNLAKACFSLRTFHDKFDLVSPTPKVCSVQ